MREIRYTFLLILLSSCYRDPTGFGDDGEPPAGEVDAGAGSTEGGLGGETFRPDGAAGAASPDGGRADVAVDTGRTGGGPDAGTPISNPIGPSPRSIGVYDESKVVDFFLTFPPGEWEKLLNLQMVEDDTRWARCSFSFEGETYPEAHCRRKGEPLLWTMEKKPQIVVRFNLVNKQGRFRGLRRLNLEFFDGTDAPIRDRLGFWIMREAGVDAPRANHARVYKDGALLGLYTNIEAVDKEFLEDHFGAADSGGNLWESGYDLKTNEDMPDEARLMSLNALVAREPLAGDHAAFFAQLDAMIDVDEVLLELAAETAALTDDNFSNGAENYLYYDHPKRGFVVLPWDLDTIYSADRDADVFAFWDTSPPNKLRQLMNQNPAWRARFVDDLAGIRDRVLSRAAAKAKAICDQVAAYVATDRNRRASYDDFWAECDFFQEAIPERIAEIKRQLGR